MTITNTELAAQLQDVATSWQSFNLQQLNWLTTTADTVTLTDHVTLQEITVKSLYKIEADYDAVFNDATGDLAQISQMLTDTQALQASMTTMHDAVVAYDVTFTGYLAQTAQNVTDCDDSAAAAAASALAAANSALAAGGHADDAEAARDLALGYRNEAETFKTQAQTAKTDAESEAAAALTSRNEAMTFRNESETAKTGAENARDKAQQWATEAEDVEVAAGEYSAKHHAIKAASSALAAGDHADDAESEAAAALTSRNEAGTFASNAADWAVTPEDVFVPGSGGSYSALHHAAKASVSATNASTSEANALTYKDTAEAYAIQPEDSFVPGSGGEYSAKHHAAKAEDSENKANQWANEAEDVAVEPGLYSALHHSLKALSFQSGAASARDKAEAWANEAEDVEVEPGLYSAKHWAAKAEDFWGGSINVLSDVNTTGVSDGDTLIYSSAKGVWEPGAGGAGEPNNISDTDATDLTDGGASSLHYHLADRNRSNHTGTQLANTISNFDTAVSNNPDVLSNTNKVSADGSVATHSDVSLSSPTSGQLLTYNGSSWTNQTPNTKESLYVSLGASGGLSGLTTESTAVFNSEDWNSNGSVFSLSSNAVTISKSKPFLLSATMSFSMTDTNASTVRIFIQKSTNGGASWSLIPNTLGHVSIPGSYRHGTVSTQVIINVTSGDMFRIRAFRLNGSSTTLFQVNNSSQLTITEL